MSSELRRVSESSVEAMKSLVPQHLCQLSLADKHYCCQFCLFFVLFFIPVPQCLATQIVSGMFSRPRGTLVYVNVIHVWRSDQVATADVIARSNYKTTKWKDEV